MLPKHDASLMEFGTIPAGNAIPFDNAPFYVDDHTQYGSDELVSIQRSSLKKTTKFIFSHIGLVGLVIVYVVVGAYIFQLLEEHETKLNCQEALSEQSVEITKFTQTLLDYMQNNITSPADYNSTGEDNAAIASEQISSMLYEYRSFIIQSSVQRRYYGDGCKNVGQWTFANSLLFAMTVITTIGYGNITPITWEGQICCICYAIIGIPIFLLCLANISGILGEIFRYLYGKVLCAPCLVIRRRRTRTIEFQHVEDNAIGMANIHTNASTSHNKTKRLSEELSNTTQTLDDFNHTEKPRYFRVSVPLTISMIIIAAYIYIGSAMFHSFENWSMMQAGYFCFITLATIGFGDFVPGQRADDANTTGKLILGCFYALFGMALLAMCFDLMQEEIVAKFRWLGTKIGIISKEEVVDHLDNTVQPKNDAYPSPKSSDNNSNMTVDTTRTTIDYDNNQYDLSTEQNVDKIRKTSYQNNIARIHSIESCLADQGNLYQRIIAAKFT